LEKYYYWGGYKDWNPFPIELKEKLLEMYEKNHFHMNGLNRISMKEQGKS
jgi:hypothetical protein